MNCEYVRNHYGVPAEIGRRVIAYGKPGIIAADRGHYIGVNLDEHKPGRILPYHPVDGIVYGEMGEIRKMTRAQIRYQEYREVAECYESFMHFLQSYKHRQERGWART